MGTTKKNQPPLEEKYDFHKYGDGDGQNKNYYYYYHHLI